MHPQAILKLIELRTYHIHDETFISAFDMTIYVSQSLMISFYILESWLEANSKLSSECAEAVIKTSCCRQFPVFYGQLINVMKKTWYKILRSLK